MFSFVCRTWKVSIRGWETKFANRQEICGNIDLFPGTLYRGDPQLMGCFMNSVTEGGLSKVLWWVGNYKQGIQRMLHLLHL